MNESILIQIGREELNKIVTDAVRNAMGNQTTSSEPEKPIKGIYELAKFLGVSASTAQKLKNQKIIKCFQSGSLVLFDPVQVRADMANHKIAGKKWVRVDPTKVK